MKETQTLFKLLKTKDLVEMASASSNNVSVDEINDLLTCAMCLETLTEPRSLPCFHNFCKICLGKFIFLFTTKIVKYASQSIKRVLPIRFCTFHRLSYRRS